MGHFIQWRAVLTVVSFLLSCLLPAAHSTNSSTTPPAHSTTSSTTPPAHSTNSSTTPPPADSWCFVKEGCNQNSPNSAWNQGTCKTGKLQSPIDLNVKNYEDLNGDSEIDFTKSRLNYDFIGFTMKNGGRHVELSGFKTASGKPPTFNWPDQNDSTYTLQQIHMHWGPSNINGSEHSIAGQKYAMEMHLIHYKSSSGQGDSYKDIAEAKQSKTHDALATVAIMFQPDSAGSASESLEPLVKNLDKVALRGEKYNVEEGTLKVGDLLKVQTKALTYQGSTTTPTCDEVVAWLVFHDPVNIKGEDLQVFRSTVRGVDGKILKTNRRRTQASNNRLIGVVNIKQ